MAKLHQRLGKPVSLTYQVVAPATSTQEATTKTVTATPTPSHINVVDDNKLSMSGNDDSASAPKVHSPTASASGIPGSAQDELILLM